MNGGVIAAGDPLTAEVGAQILRQGGNAVDAAVAAAFASFMSEIGVVHLGGSGIAQIYDPASGQGVVYDFFSTMPGEGRDHIDTGQLDFKRRTIDFGSTTQDFFIGRGSVAVPGNIYGLCQMVHEFGRLTLPQVLAPAIELARDGMPISTYQAATSQLLYPLYTDTPSMREIFVRNGEFIRGGDRLFIPHLADTLTALAIEGETLIRHGRLGRALIKDQAAYGGLITAADLANYQVAQHEPIRISYRGNEILLPRPCSTGGILTAFTFKLLSRFDVPQLEPYSVNHLQLLCEAQAATTRARLHWELARKHLPVEEAVRRFLHDEFVADFATEVMMALMKGRPSRILDEQTGRANTSHLSVIDREGMAVSLTTTAGESAGYVVPETGFIPNNMLGEEDLHPNGFHNMPAGQRIPTMMTPTIVLRDGHTRMVTGSGGSIRIRSAILQSVSNLLDFGMKLDEAINHPRVHLEHRILQCEVGIDPAALDELESLGYVINRWNRRSMYFGGAHTVSRVPDGRLVSAGDNRRSGSIRMVD